MSLRTSAARYAKALLDVAIQESDPAQVERDLSVIAQALSEVPELQRVLTSDAVTPAVRVNVVRALAARAGLQPPTARLLVMLAERNRLELLPDLVDVYRERLLAHHNIVRGQVSSAIPLSPERVQALEASLGGATGKKVQLDVSVDPSLIGGVVARIGSTVYDGSVRTQLQNIRKRLVEEA